MSVIVLGIVILLIVMAIKAGVDAPRQLTATPDVGASETRAQLETILNVLVARGWSVSSAPMQRDAPAHGGIGRVIGWSGAVHHTPGLDLGVVLIPTRREEGILRLALSGTRAGLPDGVLTGPEGVQWFKARPGEVIAWAWPEHVDGVAQLEGWLRLMGVTPPARVMEPWARVAYRGTTTWRFGEVEGEWTLDWDCEVHLGGALTADMVTWATLAEALGEMGRPHAPAAWQVLDLMWQDIPAEDERAWRAILTQQQRAEHDAVPRALAVRAALAWREGDAALPHLVLLLWRVDRAWRGLRAWSAAERAELLGVSDAEGWTRMLMGWVEALLEVLPPVEREREEEALFGALASQLDWSHDPVRTLTSAGWRVALGLGMSEHGLKRLGERQLGEVWTFLCTPPPNASPAALEARVIACSIALARTPLEAGYRPMLAMPGLIEDLEAIRPEAWASLLGTLRRRESAFVHGDWRGDAEACALALFVKGGRHTKLREEALLVLNAVGGPDTVRGLGGFLGDPGRVPGRLRRRAQEVADALVVRLGDALPRGDGGLSLVEGGHTQAGELSLSAPTEGALTMRDEG